MEDHLHTAPIILQLNIITSHLNVASVVILYVPEKIFIHIFEKFIELKVTMMKSLALKMIQSKMMRLKIQNPKRSGLIMMIKKVNQNQKN